MPEQGACHEVAGEHGTMDRDERPMRELVVRVDPACEQVLPCAAFSSKQHDSIRGRHLCRRVEKSPETGAFRFKGSLALRFIDALLELEDFPLQLIRGGNSPCRVP